MHDAKTLAAERALVEQQLRDLAEELFGRAERTGRQSDGDAASVALTGADNIRTLCEGLAEAERERDEWRERAESTYGKGSDGAFHAGASAVRAAEAKLSSLQEEVGRLREDLGWYGKQARLCRLMSREGHEGRNALFEDGGKLARSALARTAGGKDAG